MDNKNGLVNKLKKLKKWFTPWFLVFQLVAVLFIVLLATVQWPEIVQAIFLEVIATSWITSFLVGFKNPQDQSFTEKEIENAIKNTINDDYIKESEINEEEIKREIIKEFVRDDKQIGKIFLNKYVDLMDIASMPNLGTRFTKLVTSKISKMIQDINYREPYTKYGIVSPKSENVYLTSLIANKLKIPLMFVKAEPPSSCYGCEGNNCISQNEIKSFISDNKSDLYRILDCRWEKLPKQHMEWILFEDVILSGNKLCFTAAVIKNLEKMMNIKISKVLVIVRRKEVKMETIIKKLNNFIKVDHDNFYIIWEFNDADIYSLSLKEK